MNDVREDILARLLVVVAAIPNIRSAWRNNIDIPEEALPAVVVFDGDEETTGGDDRSARPSNRPYVTRMMPEIVIAQQDAQQVGPELTAMRRELIRRVLTDAELNALIGGNGAIRYMGCQTDVGWMRSLHGVLMAMFVFQYSLKIEEL